MFLRATKRFKDGKVHYYWGLKGHYYWGLKGQGPEGPEGSDLIATVNYHSRHLIS